ncbi:PAS domain-containing protein [Neobacillus niacini]|uniref:helix-turn-helix transcriptional regulator n=1 Tax=Neobacillus niacini TaxID=86668 RepID=UPI002FFEFE18
MDKNKEITYSNLVQFLGKVLGPNYEVVLHSISLDNLYNSHIAAIANNHISGRTKNAPLTGMVIEMVKNKEYLNKDFITNYKGITKDKKEIRSSTFFIKEKDELVGALCINFDSSRYSEISKEILELAQIFINPTDNSVKPDNNLDQSIEYLSESLEDVIYSIIDPSLLENEDITLSQNHKINIVRELELKGIFQLKGAVPRVAELLRVSEPSVYRYLKIIEREKKEVL